MRAVGFRSADRVEGFGFDFFSVSERFRDEVHFLFFLAVGHKMAAASCIYASFGTSGFNATRLYNTDVCDSGD